MLDEKLKKLGLSDKESKVYLAMLKLGVSTASKIAKASGVRRATTYMILDSLEEKKLVSKVEKEKILYYYPEEPDKINKKLLDEEKQLKDRFLVAAEIMPDLKNLFKQSKSPPKFQIWQGKESTGRVAKDIYSGKIDDFINMVPMTDYWTPFLREKNRQKAIVEKVGKLKLLLGKGKSNIRLFKHKNFEVRYIDLEKYPFVSEIIIYDEIVSLLNPGKEELTFTVKNMEMAVSFYQLFKFIWDRAKEYKY